MEAPGDQGEAGRGPGSGAGRLTAPRDDQTRRPLRSERAVIPGDPHKVWWCLANGGQAGTETLGSTRTRRVSLSASVERVAGKTAFDSREAHVTDEERKAIRKRNQLLRGLVPVEPERRLPGAPSGLPTSTRPRKGRALGT